MRVRIRKVFTIKFCFRETKIFRERRILHNYIKHLSYKELLYSMYDHYSSLILFQKEVEQRRVTKTPLWDSVSCKIIK